MLVLAPQKDPRAWRFHAMVLVYLLLLMLISDSFYSIKTAALLWYILGTANSVAPAPSPIVPVERRRPEARDFRAGAVHPA